MSSRMSKHGAESNQMNMTADFVKPKSDEEDINNRSPRSDTVSHPVPEAPDNQKINLCVPAINTETLHNLELNQEITFRESHREAVS